MAFTLPDISNSITSADKVGNWWILKADGTSPSGSAITTFTKTNSGQPIGVSPLGFSGLTNWDSTANQKIPAQDTDFSLLTWVNFSDQAAQPIQVLAGHISTGANLSYILQSEAAGELKFGVGTVVGTTAAVTSSAGLYHTASWVAIGCTYQFSTGIMTLRVNGRYFQVTAAHTGNVAYNVTTQIGEYAPGGGGWNFHFQFTGQSYGYFLTEKLLSNSDIDRILSGTFTTPTNFPYTPLLTSGSIVLGLGFVPTSVDTASGSYTVSGSTPITVDGVHYTNGDTFVTLSVSGTLSSTGSYYVTTAANSIFDPSTNSNVTTPVLAIEAPAAPATPSVVVSGPTPLGLTSFSVYDNTGLPLSGVFPVFLSYSDLNGAQQPQPTIYHVASGTYAFVAPYSDLEQQRAYLIDAGSTATPRYTAGSLFIEPNQFATMLFTDTAGNLFTGSLGSVMIYKDVDGTDLTPPTVKNVYSPAIPVIVPSTSDLNVGVEYVFSGAAGAVPSYYAGSFVADAIAPSGTLVLPAQGLIVAQQALVFNITDNFAFGRTLVTARLSGVLNDASFYAEEVIYRGDSFGYNYTNASNTVVAIASGSQFTVLRDGGWPIGLLEIDVYSVDKLGNED